jgi:hypothetical protein
MRTFFADLTGANCTLGGQTLISLSVTEDIDADYDTASAVCLAPEGPYPKGAGADLQEGGVITGKWTIDEWVTNRSGERTWRKRAGSPGYAHIPLVSYRLRRFHWLEARSTLSRVKLSATNYPPKFCTAKRHAQIIEDLRAQRDKGEITSQECNKQISAWHPVNSAGAMIQQICAWVGLTVQIGATLDCCADEYIPVDKPAMTAIREVASWSGRSVFLDRNGVVRIFDWPSLFSSGSMPTPAAILEEEIHDGIFDASHVTVCGSGNPLVWTDPEAGRPRANPRLPYREATPGGWSPSEKVVAIDVTEALLGIEATYPVAERIEIRDYKISPTIAQRIARERLARIAMGASPLVLRGPASGCQSIHPLTSHVSRVTRTLDWTGTGYKYEIEITSPRLALTWPTGSWNATGWW